MRKNIKEFSDIIKITVRHGASKPLHKQDDWQQRATGYRIQLTCEGRRAYFDYWMGSAHTKEPELMDILSSLWLDISGLDQTFESWTSDLGYDPDSRKAEAIYKACQAAKLKLKRLFGSHFEEFVNAENDY